MPKVVDQNSGYRYYDFNNIERARAIALLRGMMFSLDEIKSILKNQFFRSYAKLFSYIRERGYEAALPSREVYLKGPGMIFKGNPDQYLTEIQVVVS